MALKRLLNDRFDHKICKLPKVGILKHEREMGNKQTVKWDSGRDLARLTDSSWGSPQGHIIYSCYKVK